MPVVSGFGYNSNFCIYATSNGSKQTLKIAHDTGHARFKSGSANTNNITIVRMVD